MTNTVKECIFHSTCIKDLHFRLSFMTHLTSETETKSPEWWEPRIAPGRETLGARAPGSDFLILRESGAGAVNGTRTETGHGVTERGLRRGREGHTWHRVTPGLTLARSRRGHVRHHRHHRHARPTLHRWGQLGYVIKDIILSTASYPQFAPFVVKSTHSWLSQTYP